jgi:hypothetical protein
MVSYLSIYEKGFIYSNGLCVQTTAITPHDVSKYKGNQFLACFPYFEKIEKAYEITLLSVYVYPPY